MLSTLAVWENAKKTQKTKDSRKAYLGIYNTLFGNNVIFYRSDANLRQISALTYDGKHRNFDM